MKKFLLFSILLICNTSIAQTPTGIGGFELNTDIKQYEPFLKASTTLPMRFMEGISEVETQKRPGFKSGYIAYGTCAAPGKVVRIKLKYKNTSKSFYKELLEAYQDKFGKAKWLGDPFHVISTWKWSFEDVDTRVDLYLQHNLSNAEEKLGNSVKITMLNLVRDEISCFETQNPDFRKSIEAEESGKTVSLEDLLPD
jgi:hypothetical protein